MAGNLPEEILSSPSRKMIADLLSRRPRTLKELADKTGVSIPAVLKHLDRLESMGVLEKRHVSGGVIPARVLYSLKGVRIEDFSVGDLTIVYLSESTPLELASMDPLKELGSIAVENIIQKRLIREKARRLQRAIGQLFDNEERLKTLVASLGLDDGERLIVETAYTEETMEEAEKALADLHGIADPRRSIERALAKARRNVKKP